MPARNQGDVVVRRATYIYDGQVAGDVRIVRTAVRLGSGDYEDQPEVRDDQSGTWFDVEYTPAGARGVFSNGTPGFPTLEQAVESVERRFPGVTWLPD